MFEGLESRDKDPRKSLHVDDVALPELGPGEALVAVMASAINYNTVWTSIFEPVSTFGFLERYGRMSPLAKRHDLPYHVVGSDLSGVVLKTGAGVHQWKPGDRVVAHCLSVELEGPDGHNDTMLDPEQRIWGFETNFGGLADIALVKANQLMPKPEHLTWEEAASPGLVNCTAYRQLVSKNGGDMKQGDNVLIWGASGGLGGFATQYALNGGATPVCVVSNEEKAAICRSMGAELIINRSEEDFRFWNDEGTQQDPKEWKRLGAKIRELTGGEDIDIVFEHPGRETFGATRLRHPQGRHDHHLRLDQRLHARVRQPLPLDEPQADHQLPLRQLPRVVGGQPADRQGQDPPDAVADLRARRGRPGRARRPPQHPPGQGRRALPGPRGGPRRPRRGDARPAPGRDQPLPRGLTAEPATVSHPGPRRSSASRGGSVAGAIGDTGPTAAAPHIRKRFSTYERDQGLSIFDDEPEHGHQARTTGRREPTRRQADGAEDPGDPAPAKAGSRPPSRSRTPSRTAAGARRPPAAPSPAAPQPGPPRRAARTGRPRRPPALRRRPGRRRRASRSSAAAATTRPPSTRASSSSPARRPGSSSS